MRYRPSFRECSGFAAAVLLVLSSNAAAAREIEGDPKNMAPAAAGVVDATPPADTTGAAAGSGAVVGVLPAVRLTPRDVSIVGLDDPRVDLAGTWDYAGSVPAGFDGTAVSITDWKPMEVPGHPALQGYDKMADAMGVPMAYHRTFTVPAEWEGRRVVLRFEGIDGLTKLWINGTKADENEIATLPSEFDITDHVNVGGDNELVLTVEKSLVTYWSRREVGGINREVFLLALPPVNLARLHVDTDLMPTADGGDPDRSAASMNVHLRVANQTDATSGALTVRFGLTDGDGWAVPLGIPDEPVVLPRVTAGQLLEIKVPVPVSEVTRWTAETPNLYTLTGELSVDGEPVMSARQRFGFRTVATRGGALLVNGSPVKLRGTNYHITYPDRAELVPTEFIEHDLELFREANFNALRSRPTPAYGYVEACDEQGIYTTVEAMVSLMMYAKGPLGDNGADPSIAVPFRHHVATMIESYYSNPSVLTWGLGNENPYYDYFKVAALGAHAADPTRPLFFGSDARLGVDIPFMDLNDDHYPRRKWKKGDETIPYAQADPYAMDPVRDGPWDYPTDRPAIFTEWLHLHTNNWKEIQWDPGIDDRWGRYSEIHMRHLHRTPSFAGGFHFKGAPYRGIGADGLWRGVFDEDRRKNDTFWHVRKSHSPVRIENPVGERRGDDVVFVVENRYDFLNLNELAFGWTHGDASGGAAPDVAPHASGELVIPVGDDASDGPIELEVRTPAGGVVDRYTLALGDDASDAAATGEDDAAAYEPFALAREDGRFVLTRGDVSVTVDEAAGRIVSAAVGGQRVINGPVTAAVLPAHLHNFKGQQKLVLVNQLTGWKADTVSVDEEGDAVTVRAAGKFTFADAAFETTFAADGTVAVSYTLTWTGDKKFNVFAAGVRVPVDPALNELFWERRGQWSVYPEDHIGRTEGRAPAGGDPAHADARAAYDEDAAKPNPRPWPWSQDVVFGVTRDFRSTKFDLIRGGLDDGAGAGIAVAGTGVDDPRHLHAAPAGETLGGELFVKDLHPEERAGFDLDVYHFHNGGTEPHLTKSIRFAEEIAGPGWTTSGQATFHLLSPTP